MPAPVPVGKSYSDSAFVTFVVLAVLGGVLAIVAAAAGGTTEAVAVIAGFGGLFALLAVGRSGTIARNRRSITPNDDGFILTDRRGEFHFTDEMVSDLATWPKVVYSNGVPKCHRRIGSFVITAGESSVTFDFEYTFPLNQPDPLGAMLERIFNKLLERAKASIQGGGRLAGDGWALDRNQFLYTVGKEGENLSVRDVAAVDVFDGKVCVWRKGDAEAVLRVPAGSPNALVMCRVLREMMPPSDAEAEPADGLGRIVFERDQSIRGANLVAGVILITIGLAIGLGLLAGGLVQGAWVGILIGLAIFAGCAAGAYAIWDNRVKMFRCHAYGVARTTRRGVTKLQYRDVGTFTYSGVRQYVNGAYTGTTVTLRFEPLEEDKGEPIVYSATFKNADDELENLREFISRVVAGHMLRRHKAGQVVRWTKNLVFRPAGLEASKVGWFRGKGESNVIPYNQISAVDISDGIFRLAFGGQRNWAVEEPVSQPNFFPGYVLLMMILHPPEPAPAETAPAAEG
jgi:hypothetical protein